MFPVRVVLVEPTHPNNIGAVARAMKTMALTRLTLVQPLRFPHAEATARAAGADDVLHQASICANLAEAVADCQLILATTARTRTIPWPTYTPPEAAVVVARALPGQVALVFGREHSGLTNEELLLCHGAITIPTQPEFRSLNLGSAVQIVAYEVYQRLRTTALVALPPSQQVASAAEVEALFAHLEQAFVQVGFFDPAKPRQTLRRVKKILLKAQLESSEVQMLRGLCRALERHGSQQSH